MPLAGEASHCHWLSVEKFLFTLENISASVEEILFLARGFQYDTDSELRKEIIDVLDPKNIAPLEDCKECVVPLRGYPV